MRTLRTILLTLLSLAIAAPIAHAQDAHFSQYNAAPLMLNPAFAGLNGCDYRVGANFRTQWLNVSGGNTYRTTSVFGDVAIGKATRYSNFAGLGVSFVSDQAGDLNLGTNKVDLSAAYHVLIDGNRVQSLSMGIYGGVGVRSIDQTQAVYGDQLDPVSGFDPGEGGEVLIEPTRVYADAGAGFIYSYGSRPSTDRPFSFHLGVSLAHVNQPNLSFFDDASERLYLRFVGHGGSEISVSDRLALMPGFAFMKQGPSNQFLLSHWFKYRLNPLPGRSNSISFGTMYRLRDALVLGVRGDFAGVRIGFSYDINLSELTSSTNTVGGPEFSLSYTGCFTKKNKERYCPAY